MRALAVWVAGTAVALFAGCGSSNDTSGTRATGGKAGSGGSTSGGSGGALGGSGGTTGGSGGALGGSGGVTGGSGGTTGGSGGIAGSTNGGTGGVAGAGAGGVAGSSGGTGGTGGTGGGGNGALKTVFIVMMENHSWSTIKASASAPYINGTLAIAGGHAEQYFTPTGLHPSEPNYIWLEAGTNLGITTDNPPANNHQSTTNHLVTQLDAANISWKAYVEDISGTTCPLTDSGLFVTRHTPQLFFDDVTNTNDPNSQKCIQHVRPYTELANDLSSNSVARYNFISPNLCHDMHGETFGTTCNTFLSDLVKTGDTWLSTAIPAIQASSAYTNGGVIFVAWDEGDELLGNASDGPIPFFVLSPLAKTNYQNSTKYTHSALLRTVQEIFGVPFLGDAANAPDLSDFFTTFP